MHTYLPSYCRGPNAKAKDLTTRSVVKGKGKGRERAMLFMNVVEIAKSRAQE
jgi:hypothetical protein